MPGTVNERRVETIGQISTPQSTDFIQKSWPKPPCPAAIGAVSMSTRQTFNNQSHSVMAEASPNKATAEVPKGLRGLSDHMTKIFAS
jgi:hypothetical protein